MQTIRARNMKKSAFIRSQLEVYKKFKKPVRSLHNWTKSQKNLLKFSSSIFEEL